MAKHRPFIATSSFPLRARVSNPPQSQGNKPLFQECGDSRLVYWSAFKVRQPKPDRAPSLLLLSIYRRSPRSFLDAQSPL